MLNYQRVNLFNESMTSNVGWPFLHGSLYRVPALSLSRSNESTIAAGGVRGPRCPSLERFSALVNSSMGDLQDPTDGGT